MPIYEFACRDCDHRFEELVRLSDPAAACPECGSRRADRLMSAFSVRSVASGSDLVRAMSQAGESPSGGCCGGTCGGH